MFLYPWMWFAKGTLTFCQCMWQAVGGVAGEGGRQHRRHLISCVLTFVWSPQSTPAPPQGALGKTAIADRHENLMLTCRHRRQPANERGGGVVERRGRRLTLLNAICVAIHSLLVTPCCLAASSVGGCTCHTHNGLINSALARGFSHKRFNSFLSPSLSIKRVALGVAL